MAFGPEYANTKQFGQFNSQPMQSGAVLGQYDISAPTPEAFTVPLGHACETALSLEVRIATLADRLCGSIPTEANAAKGGSVSSSQGIFTTIAMAGHELQSRFASMHASLDRIDRMIGG